MLRRRISNTAWRSGGGFDKLRFKFEVRTSPSRRPWRAPQPSLATAVEIDTGLDLNHRGDGRPQVHIDIPIYGGGM